MTAGAVSGALPYWLACLANAWIAYLMYMPLHEATHGNLSGTRSDLRFANDVAGHLSSPILWFSFSAHRLSHMRHHAYANDPERDPDYFIAGPLAQLPFKTLLLAWAQTIVPLLDYAPRVVPHLPGLLGEIAVLSRERRTPEEARFERRFIVGCWAVFAALTLSGHFLEALVLWWLPGRLGMGLMVFFFAWLPHHPHLERGRYRDTRVTLFPGSRLLIRGHDCHLLHHMFPRVPHHRLPALFAELRPELEAHGARIEGPLAGPGAPPIGLRSSA